MSIDYLKKLCEADGIASNEQEIRMILAENVNGEISFDNLGGMIVRHKGDGVKMMFCAHMDEVGFMVRHISDIGMLHLINVGGVKDSAKSFQKVNISKIDGTKVKGLMNCSYDENHKVKDLYADVGVSTAKEVEDLGINIGDMVCFDSASEMLSENVIMAKALDDRIGCYVLKEIDRRINPVKNNNNDIYLVYTSSEEVGIRGGKTATKLVNPDIVFAIDVACAPDLIRNYTNQRQLSKGCMIVHYDKTMIPNKKFLNYMKDLATKYNVKFQCDMFSGGGTDAGNAHLVNGGKLAIVLGVPLRYCHGNYSMVDMRDVEEVINLCIAVINDMSMEKYNDILKFI
ncbi:TPA: aminopeptidase [Clostridioides difficile]